jgi:hypothetical protein
MSPRTLYTDNDRIKSIEMSREWGSSFLINIVDLSLVASRRSGVYLMYGLRRFVALGAQITAYALKGHFLLQGDIVQANFQKIITYRNVFETQPDFIDAYSIVVYQWNFPKEPLSWCRVDNGKNKDGL